MRDRASPFAEFVDMFLSAKPFAEKSRDDYRRLLLDFDLFVGGKTLEESLTLDNARRWIEHVKGRGPVAATNGASYLKSLASWAADARYLYSNDGDTVLRMLVVPRSPRPEREPLTTLQINEILAALAERPHSDRERCVAYFLLLLSTGLKRDQARQFLVSDFHVDKTGKRGWINVATRRKRERRPVDRQTVSAVKKYLTSQQRPAYVGRAREPLFLTEDGNLFTEWGWSSWNDRIWEYIKETTPSRIKSTASLLRLTWQAESKELIRDIELRDHCERLLTPEGNFDSAVREACVVLEDRVRMTIGAAKTVITAKLMEAAFGGESPPLRLSDLDPEQLGAMQMYRGLMAFYRNPTGHHLRDDLSRNDALRVIGWIDHLLGLMEHAVS